MKWISREGMWVKVCIGYAPFPLKGYVNAERVSRKRIYNKKTAVKAERVKISSESWFD